MTMTSDAREWLNQIGLELTHDQGYALANLLAKLTDDTVGKLVQGEDLRLSLEALRELRYGLDDAGFYQSEDTESPDA